MLPEKGVPMKCRLALLPIILPLVAACGGGAVAPSSAPAAISAPATSSAAKPAASVAPTGSAAPKPAVSGSAAAKPVGSGAPAANPTYTEGTVQAIDATKLTLVDGKALTIGPNTNFSVLQKESPSDIKVGQFAAITAKLQTDGTLLASLLRLQDSSGGRPASQSPMDAVVDGQPVPGNLMTNAPVKQTSADSMVVTLPAGDATVKFAPGIQIVHQVDGTASDAKAGRKVFIVHRGDAASSVGVYA